MKYLNKEKKSLCPVCNKSDGILLYKVDSLQATRHFRLKNPDPEKYYKLKNHIEKLWKKKECEIIKCKNCHFCYAYPYIGGDYIFYSLAYEREGYPVWKFDFQMSFEAIKKLSENLETSKSRVIEIGAGDGAFLTKISPKYFLTENVYATEFSSYGINKLEEKGFKVIKEDFRKLNTAKLSGCFDFIFLHQVLEHLDDLEGTFKALGHLANPNAYLFIAVPNSESIEFNELNGALLDMPPNHVGRWTKKSFEVVALKYNWIIEDYKVEDSSYKSISSRFSNYKYLKRSQKKRSIENILESYNGILFKIICYPLKRLIREYYKIISRKAILSHLPNLGVSQWILLRKLAQ